MAEGLNINCIMPEFFANWHQLVMRRYVDTGVSKILNNSFETIARHQNGEIIPISLQVSIEYSDEHGLIFKGVVILNKSKEAILVDRYGTVLEYSKSLEQRLRLSSNQQFLKVLSDRDSIQFEDIFEMGIEEISEYLNKEGDDIEFLQTETNLLKTMPDSSRKHLKTKSQNTDHKNLMIEI